MKRFWLVLLSLGLVMAFSASAFAGDVKFSGEMYVGGIYLDKTTLKKESTSDGPSTAFYFQRLRVNTEFIAAPGVSVVTRADIMERILGGGRSGTGTTADYDSAGTRAENENIAFDLAYIRAVTPIGILSAGYIPFGTWGTVFGNSGSPKGVPGVNLAIPAGDWMLLGWVFKVADSSLTSTTTTTAYADGDYDLYLLGIKYAKKNIEAGILTGYARQASYKPSASYTREAFVATPYFKATFGPVYLEGELNVGSGKDKKYEAGVGTADKDVAPLQAYLSGTATFGPAYVGATVAYYAGDDPNDSSKTKFDPLFNGIEWSPNLIMWNKDRAYTVGNLNGNFTSVTNATANATAFGANFQNAFFWQVRAGVKPTDKLDIMASLSSSTADQNPAAGWVSKEMGYEIDLTGTYKITNNLSYMLGGGYLITGDYFKGTNSANQIRNDYMVINKLTLSF